jgi:PAS domain S-box-containing protein
LPPVAPSSWRALTSVAGAGSRLLRLEPVHDLAGLQARVAELQERLDLVQEFCEAGIFERDPVTMQGRWDAWMYRIFGLPAAPPGAPAPDYEAAAEAMFEEDRRSGGFRATLGRPGVYEDRIRLRRPDGSVRHVHSKWRVLHDAQGHAARVIGVNTDDTEVFELASRARALRAELDLAIELGDIGLWRVDLASGRVHFDERACRQLGLVHDPAGLSLEQARARFHPDDRQRIADSAEETLRTGAPTDMTLRIRRGNGWRVVLSRRTLQRDATGKPVAFVGVLLDTTERVEKERRALELAQRLETAAEAARIGLWSALPDDAVPDWNRRMFEIFGLDPARPPPALGELLRRCIHADDRARVGAEVTRWMREGEGPIEIEFRVVRPSDGALRWLVARGDANRSLPAELRRFEGVAMDVTEALQAEQAMREGELARAESRAKSRFMSRVSHELRTPLNALLGFVQLLRDDRAAADPAVRRGWLAQIDTAGHHLLALIDDVVDFSRIEAGEMRLELQPVRLAELLDSTLRLVEGEAGARGISILREGLLAGTVDADPVRLRQVLLNLLSNAVKYNRAGGEVRVATTPGVGEVAIAVRDTGRGIDPKALPSAFEPFNRLGAETSGIPGTGIGLAIAKALVERMSGRIEVRSRLGEGSEFTLVLPGAAAVPAPGAPDATDATAAPAPADRQPTPAAPDRPPLPQGLPPARARVLYIEDNPVNALLVRELLAAQEGIDLEIAVDGRSGLERARAWQPDLILLDMQLPDLHGLAVLRLLLEDPATASMRCVALSANAMPADIAAARAAGAVDYWTKPIQFAPFLEGLARLLAAPR